MAAGHGTRMKSKTPKVLHRVGGRTLLDRDHRHRAGGGLRAHPRGGGHASPRCAQLVVEPAGRGARSWSRTRRKGTGHAVLCAEDAAGRLRRRRAGGQRRPARCCRRRTWSRCSRCAGRPALALLGFEPVRPAALRPCGAAAPTATCMRIVEPSEASDGSQGGQGSATPACTWPAAPDLFRWLSRADRRQPQGRVLPRPTSSPMAVAEEQCWSAPACAPETAVMGADTPMQLSQAEAELPAAPPRALPGRGRGDDRRRRRCSSPGTPRSPPARGDRALSWSSRRA